MGGISIDGRQHTPIIKARPRRRTREERGRAGPCCGGSVAPERLTEGKERNGRFGGGNNKDMRMEVGVRSTVAQLKVYLQPG